MAGCLVLAIAVGVEVSNSPSVGGAETNDGPSISDRCLEELDGFVVGGGGAGAGTW